MTRPRVQVTGLKEFNKALRAIDSDLPKTLRIALNKAADVIVTDAKPRIPSRTGRAKRSVKAQSTRTQSRVVGGGGKAKYYPWLDFGGNLPRGQSRPFLKNGRYIYNAYFRHRDEYGEMLEEAISDVARQAGIVIT